MSTAPRSPRSSPRTGRVYLDDAVEGGHVLAMAHRGGAAHPGLEGLENTLTAFTHAVDLGYRYLETDVHASTDGVLLAFHDDALDRVSDGTGRLADLPYAEIARARIGGRERVPRFEDLLDAFPDARFNVDVKGAGAVPALADLVRRRDLWDRILVGSFSDERLRAFRRLTEGRVATSAGPAEVRAWVLTPLPRLALRTLERRWGRFDAFQIPHHHSTRLLAGPRLIARAHAGRKHVHVWTVDEPGEMAVLLDRGVDGLITDRTDTLRGVLEERGRW